MSSSIVVGVLTAAVAGLRILKGDFQKLIRFKALFVSFHLVYCYVVLLKYLTC